MLKSKQNRLLMISTIIGIVIISLIGYIYIQNISKIAQIAEIVNVTKKYIIVSIVIYLLMISTTSVFTKKTMKKTMINLVKDAGKFVTGEDSKGKLQDNKNRDDFLIAFDEATLEIKEHLKDVDKQKKQIETILLHMTDGI